MRKVEQVDEAVSLSPVISSVINLKTFKASLPFHLIHQPLTAFLLGIKKYQAFKIIYV